MVEHDEDVFGPRSSHSGLSLRGALLDSVTFTRQFSSLSRESESTRHSVPPSKPPRGWTLLTCKVKSISTRKGKTILMCKTEYCFVQRKGYFDVQDYFDVQSKGFFLSFFLLFSLSLSLKRRQCKTDRHRDYFDVKVKIILTCKVKTILTCKVKKYFSLSL